MPHALSFVVPVYEPEPERLRQLVSVLLPHGAVVIVNDSPGSLRDQIEAQVQELGARVVDYDGNRGIAYALNRGVDVAVAAGTKNIVTRADSAMSMCH